MTHRSQEIEPVQFAIQKSFARSCLDKIAVYDWEKSQLVVADTRADVVVRFLD